MNKKANASSVVGGTSLPGANPLLDDLPAQAPASLLATARRLQQKLDEHLSKQQGDGP